MKSRVSVLFAAFIATSFCMTSVRAQLAPGRAEVTEKAPLSMANSYREALADIVFDRTMVNYYGARVRRIYVQQPAAYLIRIAEAQQLQTTGAKTTIAVIDTGADPGHNALRGVLIPGFDFTRNSPVVSELLDLDPLTAAALTQSKGAALNTLTARLNESTIALLDQSTIAFLDTQDFPKAFGHGTMVAGVIHLVAPSAKIMPLKAFRADGSADLADVIRAIYYAVDHGATIINMSFSVGELTPELAAALDYAVARNVVCIASAGNMGKSVKLYPAGGRRVVGVGSTNNSDLRSTFSNYDVSSASVAAPGEALITAFPGNHYAGVWGTSFSAGLVTGSAALMREVRPEASIADIEDALDHGVKIDQKMGDARLDLVLSLHYLTHD